MDLSPTQHNQIHNLWTRFTQKCTPNPQPTLLTPTSAIIQLLTLNLLPYTYLKFHLHRTTQLTTANFNKTYLHGLVASVAPTYAADLLKSTLETATHTAQTAFLDTWTLALPNLHWGRRWWTPVTANFVHADFRHLATNLSILIPFAKDLLSLPGLTFGHVWGLVLGSSLASSAALGAHYAFLLPMMGGGEVGGRARAWGASGVVNAFAAVAVLSAPSPSSPTSGSQPSSRHAVSAEPALSRGAIFAFTLAYDVAIWSAQLTGWPANVLSLGLQKRFFGSDIVRRNGAVAHLAGAAFGAVYWYFVLREDVDDEDGYSDEE